jgi:hypothetical protein
MDAFLARRSRSFRRATLRAARDARRAGVTFELATPGAVYERILEVERRSWKGRARVGIEIEPMLGFYREMIDRLLASGRLQLSFARQGGADIGYVFGAVFAGRYRGLQFSFDAKYRDLSLGNAMQLAEIERLAEAGIVEYDLGTTGDHYKRRWADREVKSAVLVVLGG